MTQGGQREIENVEEDRATPGFLWWRIWYGTADRIDRLPYVLAGVVLFALKYHLDRAVSELVFDRPWSLSNYLTQDQILTLMSAGESEAPFFGVMLLLALPFICAGVLLTVRRLRATGQPLWLVIVFFVPTLNLLFFVMLALTRSVASPAEGSGGEPHTDVARRAASPRRAYTRLIVTTMLTAALGAAMTYFALYGTRNYGVGLFIGIPFALGVIAVLMYEQGVRPSIRRRVGLATLSIIVTALFLLLLRFEGVVCLIMAAPLWVGCAALGGIVGGTILLNERGQRDLAIVVIGLVFTLPVLLGAERDGHAQPSVYAVETTITVAADASRVWRHVVTFPHLDPPTDWWFRAGVAHPIGATIVGSGPGAVRRCEFSTGAFVEPITVWDEPRLLAFGVTSNPPPMREWNPFGETDAPHLHGFLESRAGEFRLKPRSGGSTELAGTTWYQHGLYPEFYWKLWADQIIHRIHHAVLRHVKRLSEREVLEANPEATE